MNNANGASRKLSGKPKVLEPRLRNPLDVSERLRLEDPSVLFQAKPLKPGRMSKLDRRRWNTFRQHSLYQSLQDFKLPHREEQVVLDPEEDRAEAHSESHSVLVVAGADHPIFQTAPQILTLKRKRKL